MPSRQDACTGVVETRFGHRSTDLGVRGSTPLGRATPFNHLDQACWEARPNWKHIGSTSDHAGTLKTALPTGKHLNQGHPNQNVASQRAGHDMCVGALELAGVPGSWRLSVSSPQTLWTVSLDSWLGLTGSCKTSILSPPALGSGDARSDRGISVALACQLKPPAVALFRSGPHEKAPQASGHSSA